MKPVILAIARSAEAVLVDRELHARYAIDYDILTRDSGAAVRPLLDELAARQQPLALVLASHDPAESGGLEILASIPTAAPAPKRALLIRSLIDRHGQPFDRTAGRPITRALALGGFDAWIWGPWRSGDEEFHAQVTELLRDWAAETQPRFETLRLIGHGSMPDTHAVRDAMQRSGVRFAFHDADTDAGRRSLAEAGLAPGDLPAAILFDGRILRQPTLSDVTTALGINVTPDGIVFDLAVLGAGPAGLAAAVYGASEGLRTLVVEPTALGGQAGTSSLIRNYLGFPRGLSGTDLTERAFEQAWLFGADMLIGRRAVAIDAVPDGSLVVGLDDGTEIRASTVIVAIGISYRRLTLPDLDRLLGRGVFYGAALSEAPALSGEAAVVVGGGNSAGQTALHLAGHAEHVSMLIRGESIDESMSEYLVRQIEATPNVSVHLRTEIVAAGGDTSLDWIRLSSPAGDAVLPVKGLFILIGAEPQTHWLADVVARDDRGYVLTGSALPGEVDRDRGGFETSVPGVFAVGDVRAGSVKRVAAAVGEGSAAVRQVHDHRAASLRARARAGSRA